MEGMEGTCYSCGGILDEIVHGTSIPEMAGWIEDEYGEVCPGCQNERRPREERDAVAAVSDSEVKAAEILFTQGWIKTLPAEQQEFLYEMEHPSMYNRLKRHINTVR